MTTQEHIIQMLSQLPPGRLDDVHTFVEFLLTRENKRSTHTISVAPPPRKTIAMLAIEQGVKPFKLDDAISSAVGIWPEEESIDDFLRTLREWRNEDKELELE